MTNMTMPKRARRFAREPMTAAPEVALAQAEGAQTDSPAPTAPALKESKTGRVLALLQRPDGATLDELVAVTGWLPHTTRAALTGLRKKGYDIQRNTLNHLSRYTISATD